MKDNSFLLELTSFKCIEKDILNKYPTSSFKKGETIIKEDESKPPVYYIKSGFIYIVTITEDYRESAQMILGPTFIYPLRWALSDFPNTVCYKALTDVEVYKIPKSNFLRIFSRNKNILPKVVNILLADISILFSRLVVLTNISAKIKVLLTLRYLAQYIGEIKNDTIILKYHITHREIASFSGVTRETVSRLTNQLQATGRLIFQN